MKQLLITIAALVLVGCGKSQQSAPAPETKQAPITAKALEISILDAAKGGNIAVVKQLISTGADVNVQDAGGQTALHWTIEYGHTEIAEVLIAKGADVNARNYGEWTPLHTAADRSQGTAANISHKEIIELLIAKGANVNAKITSGPIRGYTPLYLAVINNNTEIAALLRKHGAKTGEELKAEGK